MAWSSDFKKTMKVIGIIVAVFVAMAAFPPLALFLFYAVIYGALFAVLVVAPLAACRFLHYRGEQVSALLPLVRFLRRHPQWDLILLLSYGAVVAFLFVIGEHPYKYWNKDPGSVLYVVFLAIFWGIVPLLPWITLLRAGCLALTGRRDRAWKVALLAFAMPVVGMGAVMMFGGLLAFFV